MIEFSDLSSPDPLKRDLAYLLFVEEASVASGSSGGLASVGSSIRCGSGSRPALLVR